MFIKLKRDSKTNQNHANENNFKPSSFFEVDDESTISEVKLQIEKYIDVPAECQEIRTLTQTLEDDEKLVQIGELIRSTGTAVMLYTYTGDVDGQSIAEPHFYGFLQLYTADEAAVQQDYERQLAISNSSRKPDNNASTITKQLQNDSGSDDDDVTEVNSSGSSAESSSDTDSDSSTDTPEKENAESMERRKRQCSNSSEEYKKKRAKRYTVISKISSDINVYLEEFPSYTGKPNDSITAEAIISETCTEPARVSLATSTSNHKPMNGTLVATEEITMQLDDSMPQLEESRPKTVSSPSSTTENEEPCASIAPERRAFIVIINNCDETKHIEKTECIELLAKFFDVFKSDEKSAQLKFCGKSGPLLQNGLIWVPCQNQDTMNWTLTKIKIASDRHKADKFSDFFKLKNYQVIIPSVAKNKDLCDVFNLIEQQNTGIKTTKWCVLERQNIQTDNEELRNKLVSCLCPNEVLSIGLDPETLNALEENNFTLNYCFWKIAFEQIAKK